MTVTPKEVAIALLYLNPDINLNVFAVSDAARSRRLPCSIWRQVCNYLFPNCTHHKTVRKRTLKCYDTFRRHFSQIQMHVLHERTKRSRTPENFPTLSGTGNVLSSRVVESAMTFNENSYTATASDAISHVENNENSELHANDDLKISIDQCLELNVDVHLPDVIDEMGTLHSNVGSMDGVSTDLSSTLLLSNNSGASTIPEAYFHKKKSVEPSSEEHVDEVFPDIDLMSKVKTLRHEIGNLAKTTTSSTNCEDFPDIYITNKETESTECSTNNALNYDNCTTSLPDTVNTPNRRCSCTGDNEHNFSIPWSIIDEFYTDNAKCLRKGWTNAFNDLFVPFHSKCVLKFKYHNLSYGSRKKVFNFFHAVAECTIKGCERTYHFTIKEIFKKHEDPMVHVRVAGLYNHIGSGRRFYNGKARSQLAKKLESRPPCIVYLDNLAEAADSDLEHGNLNRAPSKMICQKISSENNCAPDLSKDFHDYMCKLQLKLNEKPEWKGKHFVGYIQQYAAIPFYVICFTERQIAYLIELSKKGPVFLYLDATGTFIATPPFNSTRPYYYVLVLAGGELHSPIPMAEFISCKHDVVQITTFLHTFAAAIKTCHSSHIPVIAKIETDFSKALIQSVLKAFNDMNVSTYLNAIWDEIHNPERNSTPMTVIHTCSSHLIKGATQRAKKFTSDTEIRILLGAAVAMLIHTTELDDTVEVFRACVIVFGLKHLTKSYQTYLDRLRYIQAHCEDDISTLDVQSNDNTFTREDEELPAAGFTQREKSPFFVLFKKEYKKTCDEFEDEELESNPFYVPEFITYLLNELLPYTPIWTGIVIKKFGIRRDSNAPVENWNKILKYFIFDRKKRQSIPRAITKLESGLLGRIKERAFDLRTSRQKDKICYEERNSSEFNKPNIKKEEKKGYFGKHSKRTTDMKSLSSLKRTKKTLKRPSKCLKRGGIKDEKKKLSNSISSLLSCSSGSDFDNAFETWVDHKESTAAPVPYFRTFCKDVNNVDENQIVQMSKEIESTHTKQIRNTVDSDDSDAIIMPKTSIDYRKQPEDFFMIEEYPSNWSIVSFYVSKILINKQSLETLLPNEYIDDNVINSFLSTLKTMTDEEPLIFDTHFIISLLHSKDGRVGFLKWARQMKAWRYNIWLIPLCLHAHWTLCVVVFPHKFIVSLDSLHGTLEKEVILKLQGFIDMLYTRMECPDIDWSSWVVHCPNDIPSQISDTGVGANCGVHLCLWAYVICTSTYWQFREEDMSRGRMWIMTRLLESEKKQILNSSTKNNESEETRKVKFKKYKSLKVSRNPPLFSESTLEYCASLKLLAKREYC